MCSICKLAAHIISFDRFIPTLVADPIYNLVYLISFGV